MKKIVKVLGITAGVAAMLAGVKLLFDRECSCHCHHKNDNMSSDEYFWACMNECDACDVDFDNDDFVYSNRSTEG